MSKLCSECYFDIFQNASIGVMVLDEESKIISFNSAILNILIDKNLKYLALNKSEFEQVILNLIANARDAFSDKKEDKKIVVKAYENGEFCEIRFSDNGGGIATNIISNIFEPYFTTKEKGTGIGLYMSKLIIENHFLGAITVQNSEFGAEFKIKIPRKEKNV